MRPLLGEQVFAGESRSEGGFAANKVAAASLLDVQEAKDKNGKVSCLVGGGAKFDGSSFSIIPSIVV